LRLIVITVIPRHPTSPTSIVERDISIGEAGDVSIGDLQPKVAELRFWKIGPVPPT
jgi:hypothetical protein